MEKLKFGTQQFHMCRFRNCGETQILNPTIKHAVHKTHTTTVSLYLGSANVEKLEV